MRSQRADGALRLRLQSRIRTAPQSARRAACADGLLQSAARARPMARITPASRSPARPRNRSRRVAKAVAHPRSPLTLSVHLRPHAVGSASSSSPLIVKSRRCTSSSALRVAHRIGMPPIGIGPIRAERRHFGHEAGFFGLRRHTSTTPKCAPTANVRGNKSSTTSGVALVATS
jgi:hypothetical protein